MLYTVFKTQLSSNTVFKFRVTSNSEIEDKILLTIKINTKKGSFSRLNFRPLRTSLIYKQINRDVIYEKNLSFFVLNERGAHLTVDILGATKYLRSDECAS